MKTAEEILDKQTKKLKIEQRFYDYDTALKAMKEYGEQAFKRGMETMEQAINNKNSQAREY